MKRAALALILFLAAAMGCHAGTDGWRQEDGTVLQQKATADGTPIFYFNLGEWCPPYNMPSERFINFSARKPRNL